MIAGHAFAGDDVLSDVSNLKASAISDASISIESGIGALDVDALAKDAGKEKSTDAIEACFHSYGYGYGGYGCGYGSYYNSCYSSCYNYCQPYYNTCYSSFYCYRPVVYSVCYPIYNSYWGCY